MDETPIPDVDGGMTDAAPATGCEEQQIARLQRVAPDCSAAHGAHFASGPRQREARRATVDVADQTTAIEAAVGCVAAVAIRCADQPQGSEEDVFSCTWQLLRRRRCYHYRFNGLPSGTGCQQQSCQQNSCETGQKGHGRAVKANEPHSAGMRQRMQPRRSSTRAVNDERGWDSNREPEPARAWPA
jgi:hypothetical protein